MNDIRAILKTAATRIGLTAFLGRLHIVAGIVAGVALLFALVSRLSPIFGIPWVWVGPIMALVAFATALAIWYRHRQTHLQVAIAVDDRLDLREKLSTALHMSAREDAFARAAIDDAVHTARDPRTREAVRRKFRIEPPTRWWIAPALLAATVVVASLIPQGDIFAGDDEQIQPAQFAHTELTDSFEASIEKIRKNDVLKDELKSVFEELEPTKLDPEAKKSEQALRREMIKNLSDLEDRLKKIENEKSKTSEALEKALKQLKSPAKEGPAAELAKALTEGNFEAAKNALQQMQTELEEGALTPEQRQQLSQQLEEMAQQMAQLAQEKKALEEALEQAGLDKNLAASPQALQQALQQNQNLTQQQKEQLQQMAQAQQIAGQMCQGMSAAMGQMSMAMGQGQGQMGQGAAQMGQLLSDAENLKMALGQCRAMMNDIQGQCQGLGQGLSQGLALRGRQGGAFGGPGRGAGGEAPIARTPTGTNETKAQGRNPNADVIASTLFDGPLIKGDSVAQFRQVARSAHESHAESVEDDQLPRKYADPVKHYFGEMKERAESSSGESTEERGSTASDEDSD